MNNLLYVEATQIYEPVNKEEVRLVYRVCSGPHRGRHQKTYSTVKYGRVEALRLAYESRNYINSTHKLPPDFLLRPLNKKKAKLESSNALSGLTADARASAGKIEPQPSITETSPFDPTVPQIKDQPAALFNEKVGFTSPFEEQDRDIKEISKSIQHAEVSATSYDPKDSSTASASCLSTVHTVENGACDGISFWKSFVSEISLSSKGSTNCSFIASKSDAAQNGLLQSIFATAPWTESPKCLVNQSGNVLYICMPSQIKSYLFSFCLNFLSKFHCLVTTNNCQLLTNLNAIQTLILQVDESKHDLSSNSHRDLPFSSFPISPSGQDCNLKISLTVDPSVDPTPSQCVGSSLSSTRASQNHHVQPEAAVNTPEGVPSNSGSFLTKEVLPISSSHLKSCSPDETAQTIASPSALPSSASLSLLVSPPVETSHTNASTSARLAFTEKPLASSGEASVPSSGESYFLKPKILLGRRNRAAKTFSLDAPSSKRVSASSGKAVPSLDEPLSKIRKFFEGKASSTPDEQAPSWKHSESVIQSHTSAKISELSKEATVGRKHGPAEIQQPIGSARNFFVPEFINSNISKLRVSSMLKRSRKPAQIPSSHFQEDNIVSLFKRSSSVASSPQKISFYSQPFATKKLSEQMAEAFQLPKCFSSSVHTPVNLNALPLLLTPIESRFVSSGIIEHDRQDCEDAEVYLSRSKALNWLQMSQDSVVRREGDFRPISDTCVLPMLSSFLLPLSTESASSRSS
ncbi:AP2 domain transcription factor AP2VIII-5 [Cardiosporidium cionae]|uniref:AP2 domain transcription factor AP2VIII-5 n=1 Tax=Cardiosporidium cionae TaxID=476202 RepID=A0ABQ7J602_9APIC|nr:AP2 domain transcription factor AP2VIII-5 [Cardiosporidium cionae]|eukprot:KAF8819378.1 AP2 domain transcription factor AP2VIII-5 [Cardiosporidium cionae]